MKDTALPASSYYSGDTLDKAFTWLTKVRKNASDSHSVWIFWARWESKKPEIIERLKDSSYQFSPVECVPIKDDDVGKGVRFCWLAEDSIVHKCIAIYLTKKLTGIIPKTCTNFKGHGGLKQAVSDVQSLVKTHTFFFRTDVTSYYQSVDLKIMIRQIKAVVEDRNLRRILRRFLYHTLTAGGDYAENKKGLPMGSPLSNILAALYLKALDEEMAKENVVYRRYVDDWIILSEKRWPLKRAIRRMYTVLDDLGLELRPEKTQIGRTIHDHHRFTFLGYTFHRGKLLLSPLSQAQSLKKIQRLFEQKRPLKAISQYVRHWCRWAKAGVTGVSLPSWMMGLCRRLEWYVRLAQTRFYLLRLRKRFV